MAKRATPHARRLANRDIKDVDPQAEWRIDKYRNGLSGKGERLKSFEVKTVSDDGIRLWVNGQQLINAWTSHTSREDRGSIALKATQAYTIQIRARRTLITIAFVFGLIAPPPLQQTRRRRG